MMFKRAVLYLVVVLMLTSCVQPNKKEDHANQLKEASDVFFNTYSTQVEFLSFMDTSLSSSYIIDLPLVAVEVMPSNFVIMRNKSIMFAMELSESEIQYSLSKIKIGPKILFQGGVLVYKYGYYDYKGTRLPIFELCRSPECVTLSNVGISYMYNYYDNDVAVLSAEELTNLPTIIVDKQRIEDK